MRLRFLQNKWVIRDVLPSGQVYLGLHTFHHRVLLHLFLGRRLLKMKTILQAFLIGVLTLAALAVVPVVAVYAEGCARIALREFVDKD